MIYKEPLALGEVLEDWRMLNAMPLFKKGWKDKPRNYWPISPTSSGKITGGDLRVRIYLLSAGMD